MYFYVEKKGQWVTCNKLIYIYMIYIEVYLRSGFGVALECDNGVALECVANMQINTALPLRSGNGVVRMELQWSVHFITTLANFWKWHWSGDTW